MVKYNTDYNTKYNTTIIQYLQFYIQIHTAKKSWLFKNMYIINVLIFIFINHSVIVIPSKY